MVKCAVTGIEYGMHENGIHFVDPAGKVVRAYVTVYLPIAGHKSVLLSIDDECGGHYTPWQTGFFGYDDKEKAIADAKSWAEAEEIPCIIE